MGQSISILRGRDGGSYRGECTVRVKVARRNAIMGQVWVRVRARGGSRPGRTVTRANSTYNPLAALRKGLTLRARARVMVTVVVPVNVRVKIPVSVVEIYHL